MDNSKVNGLNVPAQAHTTAAVPPRASEAATNRFSRAMRESPPSNAAAATDTSRPNGTGWVHGTAIPDLTREARQDNRDYAYRRLQDPMSTAVMSGVMREVASVTPQARETVATHKAPGAELTQMIERMCSALYVGEQSVGSQRVVMALDHVLPGAAAEIVREGVHLSIRLHARTEESFRSMSAQHEALVRALSGDGDRRVDVSVVHGNDDKAFGDGHG